MSQQAGKIIAPPEKQQGGAQLPRPLPVPQRAGTLVLRLPGPPNMALLRRLLHRRRRHQLRDEEGGAGVPRRPGDAGAARRRRPPRSFGRAGGPAPRGLSQRKRGGGPLLPPRPSRKLGGDSGPGVCGGPRPEPRHHRRLSVGVRARLLGRTEATPLGAGLRGARPAGRRPPGRGRARPL